MFDLFQGNQIKSSKDLEIKYRDTIDSFLWEDDDTVYLERISVKQQGQGSGTQFINELIEYANLSNKNIILEPDEYLGGDLNRLKEFYSRFGFFEDGDKMKYNFQEIATANKNNWYRLSQYDLQLDLFGEHSISGKPEAILNPEYKNFKEQVFEKLEMMDYDNPEEFLLELKASDLSFRKVNLKGTDFIIFSSGNEYIVNMDDLPLSSKDLKDWFYDLYDHELFNYVDFPEENFWEEVDDHTIYYHATDCKNIESIKKDGLIPDCKTRAISNRSMPCAVFAHPDEFQISSYGDCVITINLGKMKSDGFTPEVIRESGVEEAQAKSILAYQLGIDDFDIDNDIDRGMSQGLSSETIAILDTIPTKYLSFPDNIESNSNAWYKVSSLPNGLYYGDIEEYGYEAEELSKKYFNILRGTEPKLVVLNKDRKVVAALFTDETNSESFSFDIVVHPDYQNMGIGKELVEEAISEFNYLKEVYGEDYYINVHVINPIMREILEKNYGFMVDQELNGGNATMRYEKKETSSFSYKISELEDDEEQEPDTSHLKSLEDLKSLIHLFVNAAQKIYNDWDASDETYGDWQVGFGGICHLIADKFCDIMNNNGIECTTYSFSDEVHVTAIALVKEGIYGVDISPYTYETGGGYNWKKISDIVFESSDILITHFNTVDEWEGYVEEF